MANIINFSDAASIALHSTILIAKSEKSLNAVQLSESLHKSKHHIGKVLQRLSKVGYLTSFRGPHGGFTMNVNPEELTLMDIYTAIEGRVDVKECPLQIKICPEEHCIYNNLAKRMTEEFINYMGSHTLKDFL